MRHRKHLAALLGALGVLGLVALIWPRLTHDEPEPLAVAEAPSVSPDATPAAGEANPVQNLVTSDAGMTPELLELMQYGLPIEGCESQKPLISGMDDEKSLTREIESASPLLAASDDPDLRLAAALLMPNDDVRSQLKILDQLLTDAPQHRRGQWFRLLQCTAGGCDRPRVEAAAIAADGGNGLVWSQIAASRLREKDWVSAGEALERAANSPRFDTYFMDFAVAIERGLAATTNASYGDRIVAGIGYSAAMAIPMYADVTNACKSNEVASIPWIDLCGRLGRQMTAQGKDLITVMVGYALQKISAERAGDPERAAEIHAYSRARHQRILRTQAESGAQALLANDITVLQRYVDNYSAYGELRAMELLVADAVRLRGDKTYDQCNFVQPRPSPL